jgi:hypothetical protein
MKIATSFLAGLLLIGTLGASDTAMAADGIIYKQSNTPGSYCHLKFPAIREDTLAGEIIRFSQTQAMATSSTFTDRVTKILWGKIKSMNRSWNNSTVGSRITVDESCWYGEPGGVVPSSVPRQPRNHKRV